MPLSGLLKNREIVICVGSGGVGKTTVSAAIALRAAIEGRKTLVLTIDPARRLANSLGLAELGNRKSRIEIPAEAKGELWGMMLDQKRAFDDLVERIAPNIEVRDRILANHYYQQLSTALAGSQEYMAMEKLHEVATHSEFDLIVLDTPPTKQALDFLDAPGRLTDFLDGKVVQWFVKPYLMAGRIGFQFAQKSAALLFKALEKGTGYQALADLSEFFLAFDGLYDGFKQRAAAVKSLLGAPRTGFVIVTTPLHPAVDEAAFFRDRLLASGMNLDGIVFNRVHESVGDVDPEKLCASAEKIMAEFPSYASAIDALVEFASDTARMAATEEEIVRNFLSRTPRLALAGRIPALSRDVHDIPSLLDLGNRL